MFFCSNALCLEMVHYAFLMHRFGHVVPNIDIWGHIQRPHLIISNIQIVDGPCPSRHCDFCRYFYHQGTQKGTLEALLVALLGHCPSHFTVLLVREALQGRISPLGSDCKQMWKYFKKNCHLFIFLCPYNSQSLPLIVTLLILVSVSGSLTSSTSSSTVELKPQLSPRRKRWWYVYVLVQYNERSCGRKNNNCKSARPHCGTPALKGTRMWWNISSGAFIGIMKYVEGTGQNEGREKNDWLK